jgi:hypothetical protein
MVNFFENLEIPSNEWTLVIGIGLVFFLIQLALTFSFCFRMKRQERAIRRLTRDFEMGGNGRPDVQRSAHKASWPNWVVSHFSGGAHGQNNFTREDALQELDTRIAGNGGYLLLQRMGVMAPLLGVVLTVAGFYWLKVDGQNDSLQSILMAVTPLVSGVGTGALLALVNQALLHVAGRRVESLRQTARNWFDTVVWGRANFGGANSSVKSVQVMEQFVRDALDDISRLNETLNKAAEISVALSGLPDQIRTILERKLPAERKTAQPGSSGVFVARLPRTAPAPPTRPVPKMQG